MCESQLVTLTITCTLVSNCLGVKHIVFSRCFSVQIIAASCFVTSGMCAGHT